MFFHYLANPTSLQRTKLFIVEYIRLPLVPYTPMTSSDNFNLWWESYVEHSAQLMVYSDIYELK
jgi:hypothetical protein